MKKLFYVFHMDITSKFLITKPASTCNFCLQSWQTLGFNSLLCVACRAIVFKKNNNKINPPPTPQTFLVCFLVVLRLPISAVPLRAVCREFFPHYL